MRAVVLALAAVSLAAGSDWFYTSSRNFEVYTSGDLREARRICEHFEQARDFFMRFLSQDATTRLPVTIVVFRDSSQFRPYAIRDGAPAYYAGAQDRDYIVMSGAGLEQFPIAVHEYVHLLVRHTGVSLPVWLNEGLAEVYSTLKPQAGRVLVGLPPPGRLETLRRERWLRLEQLLAVNEASPEYNERERMGILYAQSWLLVHMLMFEQSARDGFPRFLEAIAEGRKAEEAFESAWKWTAADVEKLLLAYHRKGVAEAQPAPVRLDKIAVMEPRAATAVEVEIHLAMLAGLLGRREEGLGRLRALVAKNPDNWRAHEALAVALWQKHDMEGTREHFRKAAELNSPNWKTWFDYAVVMYGLNDDYGSAIRALRRSLELNPDHFEAQVMLAEEYNYAGRFREAVGVVKGMQRIEPKLAARAFLAAASAYAGLGQEVEARGELDRARAAARDSAEQRRVDDLERRLEVRARIVPSAPAPPPPVRERVAGEFRELECLGAEARLHVATEKGLAKLLIRDPSRVTVKGQGPSAVLSCGPQQPGRKIVVEYLPHKDKTFDTIGDVRLVEFL